MIPEDHICYLVESIVETLDFTTFDKNYSGAGHPAYHPRIPLKILIMGVLDRVRSSRRLAKNARENVVYIYLSEKLTPDFRTISDFRKDNSDIVKEALRHTVTLAREEGLLDVTHLSTDGTKKRTNASNRRVGQVSFLVGRCKRRQNILKQPSFRIPFQALYASSSSWLSQVLNEA
ncbi:MAG TPA: transposase [Thermodesulfobacteriota bacterium]|nr:transposase [Thermodesulfobacteriota bacterium]